MEPALVEIWFCQTAVIMSGTMLRHERVTTHAAVVSDFYIKNQFMHEALCINWFLYLCYLVTIQVARVQGSERRKEQGEHPQRLENAAVYRKLCRLQIEIDKHTSSWEARVRVRRPAGYQTVLLPSRFS